MAEKPTHLSLVVDIRADLSLAQREQARTILTTALMRSSAAMKDLGLSVDAFSFIYSAPRPRRARV